MTSTSIARSGLLALGLGLLAACGGGDQQAGGDDARPGAEGSSQALTGAGATFPNPVYQKWFDAYNRQTGVRINYQSIGSGGGIRQFTEGTVDFGATDGPMTDEQIAKLNGDVVHVPTVLGAVVLTYNLPSIGQTKLRLDGETIAAIYRGEVTRWNDQRIAALNPGVELPARDIIVVHRSDGSGTSYIFTDYLAKISPEWAQQVGSGTSVKWPVGLGGKGNEGVTQQVKQTEGALGYVELIYAVSNELPYAVVKNSSGSFVEPTLETVTAAAAGHELPDTTDFRVSITNAPGQNAYPISSYTWLLLPKTPRDSASHRTLVAFVHWAMGAEAQRMAADLHYAPLPMPVIEKVKARLPQS